METESTTAIFCSDVPTITPPAHQVGYRLNFKDNELKKTFCIMYLSIVPIILGMLGKVLVSLVKKLEKSCNTVTDKAIISSDDKLNFWNETSLKLS